MGGGCVILWNVLKWHENAVHAISRLQIKGDNVLGVQIFQLISSKWCLWYKRHKSHYFSDPWSKNVTFEKSTNFLPFAIEGHTTMWHMVDLELPFSIWCFHHIASGRNICHMTVYHWAQIAPPGGRLKQQELNKIKSFTYSHTTEPIWAWLGAVFITKPIWARLGAVFIVHDVAITTSIGSTATRPPHSWIIAILKASTPTTMIADVCTILETPTRISD